MVGELLPVVLGSRQFWTAYMTSRLLQEVTTIPEGRYFLKATADKSPILIELGSSLKPPSKTRKETTSWSKRWGKSSLIKWELSKLSSSWMISNTKMVGLTFEYIQAWRICILFRMGSLPTVTTSSSKSNMNMIQSLANQLMKKPILEHVSHPNKKRRDPTRRKLNSLCLAKDTDS